MKLTDEDIKKIIELYNDNLGPTYIARKVSCNVSYIKDIIWRYKIHGIEGILHSKKKIYSPDEKLAIINRFYQGESKTSLAVEINVSRSVVVQWVSKYEKLGYNGLIDNTGRPGVTKMGRPKKNENSIPNVVAPLTNAEREELNRLRKENYRLKMENDCIKKLQALVQKRVNQQTRKK